jgi:hypothetical protein
MASYLTTKPLVLEIDGVAHVYRTGVIIDVDDATGALIDPRRVKAIEPVEPVEAPEPPADVELVAEDAANAEHEGEKPLKSHTVPELVEIAKAAGASEDSVKHLKKPQLLEAIERLTHDSDD